MHQSHLEKNGKISVDEYLALEEQSIIKHEYYQGQVVEIPGTSFNRGVIVTNILGKLYPILDSREHLYWILGNSLKVYIPSKESIVYPDILVIEGTPKFYNGRKDVILNPLLVGEIFAPETMHRDLGTKFLLYSDLPSFREYIIINQTQPEVTSFFKANENTWKEGRYNKMEDPVALRSLDCPLLMYSIYKNVLSKGIF